MGLLPKRVVGALMRADLNAGKAGSLAMKAALTKVFYVYPTDPCDLLGVFYMV